MLTNQPIFQFKLKPALPLSLAVIWCFFLYTAGGDSRWVTLGFGTLGLLVLPRLYRRETLKINFSWQDVAGFGVFFGVGFLVQSSDLFLSLGGDELYHAGRSNFILLALKNWVYGWSQHPADYFRESAWRLFDLRYLAVYDWWRWVSAAGMVFGFGISTVLIRSRIGRLGGGALALVGLIYFGINFGVSDIHPPFRLFFLFLSNCLLGYNHFAFKFPSFLASVLTCFYVFRTLRDLDERLPLWWCMACGGLVGYIPIVYYVSNQVECSIFGFSVWVVAIIEGWKYLRRQDDQRLLWIAILVALGTVTRQTTILLWGWVGFLYLFSLNRFDIRYGLRVFFPGLVAVPYFASVSSHGHIAVPQTSFLQSVFYALSSGVSPMAILNTTTGAWVIFSLFGLCLVVKKMNWKDWSPFILAIPAFLLFQHVLEWLLGIGRYQAEYIAPFLVFLIFLVGLKLGSKWRLSAASLFLCLAVAGVEANRNAISDTNYRLWGQMKITSTANFPWYEGLTYLKRQEAEGNFAILGGQPFYDETALWLSVHNFSESKRFHDLFVKTAPFFESGPSVADSVDFFRKAHIKFLVLQGGNRRERQHLSPGLKKIVEALEMAGEGESAGLTKVQRVNDRMGGYLEIFRVSEG